MEAPIRQNVRIHEELFQTKSNEAPLTKDQMINLYNDLLDRQVALQYKYDQLLKENVQINRRIGASYENHSLNKNQLTQSQVKLNMIMQEIEETKQKHAQSIRTKECNTENNDDGLQQVQIQLSQLKEETDKDMKMLDNEIDELEKQSAKLAEIIDQQKRDVLTALGK